MERYQNKRFRERQFEEVEESRRRCDGGKLDGRTTLEKGMAARKGKRDEIVGAPFCW